MTARPRRTTTLVGPNRLVVGAATAGLVALASAGTALLVLTGTSSVAPVAAPAPPLPASSPLNRAPGVVVVPSEPTAPEVRTERELPAPRPVPVPAALAAVPVALAFTDVPAVAPPVVTPPIPAPPALRRDGESEHVGDDNDGPGRHLAKGHAKKATHAEHAKHAKHPKRHGKRVGWAHSAHRGNR